jgi:TonB-dependent SusC/RagA subfamily outer membrane receptor
MGVQQSADASDIPCYLLAHSRGTVLYFSEWNKNLSAVSFNVEQFPAGVIQFVLFDGQMNPLSERMVFSKTDVSVKVGFHTDRDSYQIRDKVVSTLSFPDSLFYSFSGHFSVAVTDDVDLTVDESTTILSTLLLSSELKGYIENPAYYLHDDAAMDLLMMTHGWRRYNIPEAVKGNMEYPRIPFQLFQEISGKVQTTANRPVPVRDGEILVLMNGEGGGYGMTSTDENGLFRVPELMFPDSTTFNISASDRSGRDNVKLTVDSESFPAPVYAPQSPVSTIPVAVAEKNEKTDVVAFLEKAEQHAKFDEDMWTLQLGEVEVTAPAIKKDGPSVPFWANVYAENTITREVIDEHRFKSIVDYFFLVGGVRVVEDTLLPNGIISIYLRGTANYTGNPTEALVLIDGVERKLHRGVLVYQEIESIDIFKGPSAAIFGMRGANGVVSITTRRGGDTGIHIEKSNHAVYTPLGYQKPVAFYAPRYETPEARQSNILDYRTTIFWKPDVVISEDEGKATFEFYTADFKTIYSVVIEGLTNDGKIVRQVEKIRVE